MEATKFTEVGIYGQNVDAMVKDLVEVNSCVVKRVVITELACFRWQ